MPKATAPSSRPSLPTPRFLMMRRWEQRQGVRARAYIMDSFHSARCRPSIRDDSENDSSHLLCILDEALLLVSIPASLDGTAAVIPLVVPLPRHEAVPNVFPTDDNGRDGPHGRESRGQRTIHPFEPHRHFLSPGDCILFNG